MPVSVAPSPFPLFPDLEHIEPPKLAEARISPLDKQLVALEQKKRQEQTAKSHRPTLPEPVQSKSDLSVQERMAQFADRCVEVSGLQNEETQTASEYHLNEIQGLRERHAEKISDESKQHESLGGWSMLRTIAYGVTCAASIALGLATGGVVGALMVGSGTAGAFALALKDMGVDERIVGALSLASAALCLVGGGLNIASYTENLPALIAAIAQTASSIAGGVSSIGEGVAKSNLNWHEAERIHLQHKLEMQERELGNRQNEAERSMRISQGIVDSISRTLQNYQKNLMQITRSNQL